MLTKGIGGFALNKIEVGGTVLNIELGGLPYSFFYGGVAVLKNEIHIMGTGTNGYQSNHYKFDGVQWINVGSLPYNNSRGTAITFQNKIHLIGGGNSGATDEKQYHYTYDGTKWERLNNLPFHAGNSCLVIYNNELHLLGSYISGYKQIHYKFDGTNWTQVSSLPYELADGCAVVYNGKIHILGSYASTTTRTSHYAWNGTNWESISTLPYPFFDGAVAVIDGKIHILGGNGYTKRHYVFDGSTWIRLEDISHEVNCTRIVQHYGTTYLLGSLVSPYNFKTLKLHDAIPETVSIKVRIEEGSEVYTDGEYSIEGQILIVKGTYNYLTILLYGSPYFVDIINNKAYLLKGMMLNNEIVEQDGLVDISTTEPSKIE